jgi:hypothetical protein
LSCKNQQSQSVTKQSDSLVYERIMADTTNNIEAKIDFEEYEIKKRVCAELGLYDIEQSRDSIEIRVWDEPSMWEPHQLYILKGKDTAWKAIWYLYYQRHNNYETGDYKYWDAHQMPVIDSFKAETLSPKQIGWNNYVRDINIDSIWHLLSQSELKGDYSCLDGYTYTFEIKDKLRYKTIRYRCPNGRKELNHVKITKLFQKIIGPLQYEGMYNKL